MTTVEGQPGTFTVVVHLPPGYHQYKFIVDGEWRHDESQPFMPDPLGNVNNWLFVRKPEGQAAPAAAGHSHNTSGGLHQSLQQHSQQQHQQQHAAHPQHSHHQPQQPSMLHHQLAGHGGTAPSSRAQSVADMDVASGDPSGGGGGGSTASGGVIAPIAVQADEPAHTKKKARGGAGGAGHDVEAAYELIPESGKVVLLDIDLPMRQAFHALHEQGGALREELVAEGVQPPKPLVAVRPNDSLAAVVRTLFERGCSMAPVLATQAESGKQGAGSAASAAPSPGGVPPAAPPSPSASAAAANCLDGDVLHTATISGVLACLMRHFRASLASLPLLAQPLSALPIGTWAPTSSLAAGVAQGEEQPRQTNGGDPRLRRQQRRVSKLACVRGDTPLTHALGLLLEAGVSCLPVVDANGVLLDIYARADITMLAKSNAYARLQFEDVTVGQALALAGQALPPPQLAAGAGGGAPPPQWGGSPRGSASSLGADPGSQPPPGSKQHRLHVCTPHDALRTVVERLSVPGVRRLVVVDGESRRVEGIVSLSDVAAFLLL
ncbi:hypothetical protein CHLNCDRAFT_142561 [Chlorella variabilis]|uniref:CBS domain-containing protein n=1 Tax=Chlorella variabilis TaxID=554065 RepID=E1ZTW6_CHLVA|nr:hypothetical protein CHLNCDRAFT_142561 [Chlorella variabilis]EFN50752.1 hypothetical protein CHLNCDRAFT_142561 [Chlorella variabilis]|eukprot:XP_005842864.1 hypothetical protein CHLNCDRAFT_142561 [Chlorella variabilis]